MVEGTLHRAESALEAGGRLVTCGNAARYVHPSDEKPRPIALHKAKQIIKWRELEEYACGARWPFASWWRLPQTTPRQGVG